MKLLITVISIFAASISYGKTCDLDVDFDIAGSLKLANKGRIQHYIEKNDKTGSCYEAGSLIGFVDSIKKVSFKCSSARSQRQSFFSKLDKCKKKLNYLRSLCEPHYSKIKTTVKEKHFYATLLTSYFDSVKCLENIADKALGFNKTEGKSEQKTSTAN